MNPTSEHVMRYDAKLARVSTELILNNVVGWNCAVIAGAVSFANGPIRSPVRECRDDSAVMSGVAVIHDLRVRGAVKFNERDGIPAG